MKKNIKAVLFDLDDTLWPIWPVILRAETVLHEWIERHAPQVSRQYSIDALREQRKALMQSHPPYQIDLRGLRHHVLSDAFRACGEDVGLVQAAMTIFEAERNNVTPFDDVLPGLARLAQSSHRPQPLILGSISNGFADLEKIGLAHHFKISIAAHRFGLAKPDPAIFHAACEALEVAPGEAVYVGDDLLLDVEGAQQAGMQGVWINRTGLAPHEVVPPHIVPDAIIKNLHELEAWLMHPRN